MDQHDQEITDKEALARSVQRDYGLVGARRSDLLDWIDGLTDEAVSEVLRWLALKQPTALREAQRAFEARRPPEDMDAATGRSPLDDWSHE